MILWNTKVRSKLLLRASDKMTYCQAPALLAGWDSLIITIGLTWAQPTQANLNQPKPTHPWGHLHIKFINKSWSNQLNKNTFKVKGCPELGAALSQPVSYPSHSSLNSTICKELKGYHHNSQLAVWFSLTLFYQIINYYNTYNSHRPIIGTCGHWKYFLFCFPSMIMKIGMISWAEL